jgi:hypothetical protein
VPKLTANEIQGARPRLWRVVNGTGSLLVYTGACRVFHISLTGAVAAGGNTTGDVYDNTSAAGTNIRLQAAPNTQFPHPIPNQGLRFSTGIFMVVSGTGQLCVGYLPDA